jgi:hypothetical protein
MEELEIKTDMYVVAKVKKEVEKSGYYAGTCSFEISDFSVWVEVAGSDIDVTDKLSPNQIRSLEQELIESLTLKIAEGF